MGGLVGLSISQRLPCPLAVFAIDDNLFKILSFLNDQIVP